MLDARLETKLDDVATRANFRRSCTVKAENVGAVKPGKLPSRADVAAVLAAESSLLQLACDIYAQDYICLGLPLPEGCTSDGWR